MKVSYDKEMVEKAKRKGVHLITLEINGKYAKKTGVTVQGYLETEEDVKEAFEYLNKLLKKWKEPVKKGKKVRSE